MPPKATRIEAGHYAYRGYTIQLVEDGSYKAWNIFDNTGFCCDALDTLGDAKYIIDGYCGDRN